MGDGRRVASVSTWPVYRARPHLHDFLVNPKPLSAKATAGFWSRLQSSSLRRPRWFDAGIVKHLREMKRVEATRHTKRRKLREVECDARPPGEDQVGDATASG
jgi:DNA (cytosine-5)-methyltransferase 1